MKSCNRFLALLLTALLLATPVLANADAAIPAGVYSLYISDPVITIMDKQYDMSGLNMIVKAAPGQNGLDLAFDVLSDGTSALNAYASLGDNGLNAIMSGMTSAIGVSAETMAAFLSSVEATEETAESETPEMESPFTEEEMTALTAALEAFGAAVIEDDGAQDVATIGGNETPCLRYTFEITNEELVTFVGSVAGVLEANPVISSMISTGMAQGGVSAEDMGGMSLTDTLTAMIAQTAISVLGSCYVAENGDMMLVGAIDTMVDEETTVSIPMIAEMYTDANGGEFVEFTVYPTETESIELYMSLVPNTILEGRKDFLFTLNMNSELEGQTYPIVNVEAMFATTKDEGQINTLFNFEVNAAGASIALNGMYAENEESNILNVFFDASTGEGDTATVYSLSFLYEGTKVTEEGFTGDVSFLIQENDMTILGLSLNLGCGIDATGGSIAFDYTTVPVIDIENMDEETLSNLENELMTGLYGLLAAIQTNPGFASLMSDMTMPENTDTEA